MREVFEGGQKRSRSAHGFEGFSDRGSKETKRELGQNSCAPKWSFYRLMVPNKDDHSIRSEVELLKSCFNGNKVRIGLFDGPPKVVMVAAEEKDVALSVLVNLFMVCTLRTQVFSLVSHDKVSARLLVSSSEAMPLIHCEVIKRIADIFNCSIRVRTAENPPYDCLYEEMIIEVEGMLLGVAAGLVEILSRSIGFLEHSKCFIDSMEKKMSEGRHYGISVYGRVSVEVASSAGSFSAAEFGPKTFQRLELPLSCADLVIGEQGVHINGIRSLITADVNLSEKAEHKMMMVEVIGRSNGEVETAMALFLEKLEEVAGSELADNARNRRRSGYVGSYCICG